MPPVDDDEYYYADLIGMTVVNTGGTTLGKVKNVVDHGAGDLLEITPLMSAETIFLPFTQAAVPTVELKSGKIVADPPAGLFTED